ncbi:MAG: glycosyltransferase family 39 protein [Actinomycetota bacterium]|nr:glycosyltransferase family 39 protein [Actinomycetota bacterium]
MASRFAGLTLIVAATLTAFAPSTRAALSDLRRAARAATGAGERRHLAVLLGVVVIGVWVRARFAGQSFRFDEASTFMNHAITPLGEGLSEYPVPGNHLLHTFVQHMSWRVFGDGPLAVRLPALLAGVAIIPAVYVAGRALYDRETGLVAAGLAAASAALVEYSVNARGYTMVFLAVVLLVPLGLYAIERRSPAAALGWALVAALALYTVPVAVYGVGIVVAWAVLKLVDEPPGLRLVLFAAIGTTLAATAVLTYLLYLPVVGEAGWDYVHSQETEHFVRSIYETFHSGWPAPLWMLLGIGIAAAVVLHPRIARQRAPLWLAAAVVLPLAIAVTPRVPPFVRSWLFLLPLYLVLASAGLVALGRLALRSRAVWLPRAAGATAVVAALALGVTMREADLPNGDDPPLRDGDRVTRYLKEEFEPGDGLAVGLYAQPAFSYHFRHEGFDPGAMTPGPVVSRVDPKPGHRTLLVDSLTRGSGPPEKAVGADNARVLKRFRWAVVYEIPPASRAR